jgi:WG repeat protein
MRVLALTILVLIILPMPAVAQSADDRYPFVRDGKMGFIDYQGHEVIPPRFSNAGESRFDHGIAAVFEAGKGSGYIDTSGKFVIGPTEVWGWGRPFHEDIASVVIWNQHGNKPGWIDRTGKLIFSGMGEEGRHFADGLMSMPGPNGKWGYVDKNFKFVIEPQFGMAWDFSEQRAEIWAADRKAGFIDTSGTIVVPPKYDMAWPFQNGLASVRRDIQVGTHMTEEGAQPAYRYQYGYIDHDGNEVIPLQFEEATYFSEGYAMAVPSNFKRFGIIDKQGHFVHEPEFDAAGEFHDGLAMACVKRKCGFVDTSGAWIIPPQFQSVREFWHGLASVSWKDGDYGYVNQTGKIVWRSIAPPQPAR